MFAGGSRAAFAVRPLVELLDHPRGLAHRRIHQAVAEGLRARALLLGIAGAPFVVVAPAGERLLVAFGGILAGFGCWAGAWHVDVNAGASAFVLHGDSGGHGSAPIAALGEVAVVADMPHQGIPYVGDLADAPAGGRRLAGEAVAGQRRAHDVKRIRWVVAGSGIGQRHDHFVELRHGAGPAVGDEQRLGVRMGAGAVNEMDVQALDARGELRKAVEVRLAGAPVVVVQPIGAEVLRVGQRQALAPVVRRFGLRPARGGQAALEVVQLRIGDVDAELAYFAHLLFLFSLFRCLPLNRAAGR